MLVLFFMFNFFFPPEGKFLIPSLKTCMCHRVLINNILEGSTSTHIYIYDFIMTTL